MSILVNLGDPMNLALQLFDGNSAKRVFVDLKKVDGSLLTPRFEILHSGNGLYRESTKVMPVDERINAIYYVYNLDGVTLDTDYTIAMDIYMRDLTGEIVEDNLDKKISAITFQTTQITGDLDNSDIDGEIDTSDLSGTVENSTILEGVVYEC